MTAAPGEEDLAGAAVAPGEVDLAVAPGAADAAGALVPGPRVPQDTVTRTTATGSSRRR